MAWQTVDGELVLLNIDGKELLGVNAVGARVWELVDGVRTLDEIAAQIASDFSVSLPVATGDVLEFIGELSAAGALVLE